MRRAILYALCFCLPLVSRGQCLSIYGVVRDAYTDKPVPGVSIIQKVKGRSMPAAQGTASGAYRASLSCEVESVLVEAKGYRTQQMPVNLTGKAPAGRFDVPLKLVQVDKQASDQPYFQEQQQFVSLDSGPGNVAKHAARVFEVTDALSGKRIYAELCLFYTKTGARDCQQLSAVQAPYEVNFTSTDIIAIEVKARGYQPYFGNLIMDQLDNAKRRYQIRLSAQLNVLSVNVSGIGQKVSCELAGAEPVPVLSSDGIHFSWELPDAGDYHLTVSNGSGEKLNSYKVPVRSGLNLYSLDVKPSVAPTSRTAAKPSLTTLDIGTNARTLYFDRSEYKLRAESKVVLDTLAQWLRITPSGHLTITGHTDNVGNSKLNQTLSEYRARLTYHFLQEQGVDVRRVTYIGKGDSAPASPNDIEANKAKNRRVEIQLVTKP